jgi:hypothetical protein
MNYKNRRGDNLDKPNIDKLFVNSIPESLINLIYTDEEMTKEKFISYLDEKFYSGDDNRYSIKELNHYKEQKAQAEEYLKYLSNKELFSKATYEEDMVQRVIKNEEAMNDFIQVNINYNNFKEWLDVFKSHTDHLDISTSKFGTEKKPKLTTYPTDVQYEEWLKGKVSITNFMRKAATVILKMADKHIKEIETKHSKYAELRKTFLS